jgi:hypothetical protein
MGWIGCVHCEKFRCDFVARTFALIALVQPVLHRASCSNETILNAPKHYEMHQYISLGSNRVDRVHSLHKILSRFVARTFALIAPVQPVLQLASCSNETIQNAPRHYETHQIHEFRVQWGGTGAFVAKNSDAISRHELVH